MNVEYFNEILFKLNAQGKHALAGVICYCYMTSVMALDDVTSFVRLKDETNTC